MEGEGRREGGEEIVIEAGWWIGCGTFSVISSLKLWYTFVRTPSWRYKQSSTTYGYTSVITALTSSSVLLRRIRTLYYCGRPRLNLCRIPWLLFSSGGVIPSSSTKRV